MKFRLYRGIATTPNQAKSIISSIKRDGLSGNEDSWSFSIPNIINVRNRIAEIFNLDKPTCEDIFSETPFLGCCACGDDLGGRYYALKYNKSKDKSASILITFEAYIGEIYIDCRDFLCYAFQFLDQETDTLKEKQASTLQAIYGNKINRYFEKCI